MESFMRGASVYFVLLILFRLAGRRTLAQLTNFDFVLLLIIGEAVQNGLLGNDFSLTNAFLTVLTLISLDIVFSLFKQYVPTLEKIADGVPFIIVDHGKMLEDRMNRSRVDAGDVLEAAREKMGLERMDQIKYAVLEKSGEISIIPMDEWRKGAALSS
jgi:uncharacterized membrane protein YcaP (DUF421 family)